MYIDPGVLVGVAKRVDAAKAVDTVLNWTAFAAPCYESARTIRVRRTSGQKNIDT
jgi:hypothetical protein